MGRLAVGLARAQRLAQCSRVTITTHAALPMQVSPKRSQPCCVTLCSLGAPGARGPLHLPRHQALRGHTGTAARRLRPVCQSQTLT